MMSHYRPFAPLVERIKQDGKCLEGGILKVDSFINHQIDPTLLQSMSIEFVRRFANKDINKILTIEASGIAPAIMVGFLLNVPVVFAKKKKPSTMDNMLTTEVFSFTKNRAYTVCCSKDFLGKGDKVLFIDDFLANGNAALYQAQPETILGAPVVFCDLATIPVIGDFGYSQAWALSLKNHSSTVVIS